MRGAGTRALPSLVGTATAPSSSRVRKVGRYYRPELDVLRLLAFLLVFLHHVFRDPQGHTGGSIATVIGRSAANACGFGLCVFFFLSSYLIATLLLIELNETRGINIREFYLRRILRIWPLYAFGLAIGGIYALINAKPEQLAMLRSYTVFLGNWFFQDHSWNANPMTPLWSISVEEQFYLVVPLVVLALGAKRLLWGGLGLVTISIIALFYQGEQHLPVDTAIWTNTLSQAIFFGSGMVAAVVTHRRLPAFSNPTRLIAAIAAFILMFLAAFVFKAKVIENASSGGTILFGYGLVAVACTLLLASVLNAGFAFPAPAVYLGKISFGLYVYHLSAMRIMEHVFALGPLRHSHIPIAIIDFCSLPLLVIYAAGSYRYIEQPFLRLRAKFAYVASRPA